MQHVGILAYGSLTGDPGTEFGPVTTRRVTGVTTPFPVEFARSSRTRGGAPTLVPVEDAGSSVEAVILVLNESVRLEQATDMLWRRETRQESSEKPYPSKPAPGRDDVIVRELQNLEGIKHVLYTEIGANIPAACRTADWLAHLAIVSVAAVGRNGFDGISYLIEAKAQGVNTPLMGAYEDEILRRTKTTSLEAARRRLLQEA